MNRIFVLFLLGLGSQFTIGNEETLPPTACQMLAKQVLLEDALSIYMAPIDGQYAMTDLSSD